MLQPRRAVAAPPQRLSEERSFVRLDGLKASGIVDEAGRVWREHGGVGMPPFLR